MSCARALAAACALGAGLAGGAAAQDGAAAWLLQARSDRHNDALSLHDTGGSEAWSATSPRAGRNLAYLDDELRLQREQGGWRLGLLARSHASVVASADALRLAALVDRGERPAVDTPWQVQARWHGFSGAGLLLGRQLVPATGWSVEGELQLLRLSQWREHRIDGPARFSAASGQYDFDLHATEAGNRLDFPFQRAFAAHGSGLLLALGAAWQGPAAWARAGLRDAGWLRWRALPQQEATLSTSTQAVDANGYLVYRPLVEGRNLQDGLRRAQPPVLTVAGGGVLGGGQRAGLLLERRPGYGVLPRLLWQQAASGADAPAWQAEWRLHERRLGLALEWRGFGIEAGVDTLGGGARSRQLAFSYRWRG